MKDQAEAEAEARRKFSVAMSQQKPKLRPMEAVWCLIALVFFIAYLQKSDVNDKVIAEKKKLIQTCERNTKVAVAALNGWELQEGDVRVTCKREKS